MDIYATFQTELLDQTKACGVKLKASDIETAKKEVVHLAQFIHKRGDSVIKWGLLYDDGGKIFDGSPLGDDHETQNLPDVEHTSGKNLRVVDLLSIYMEQHCNDS